MEIKLSFALFAYYTWWIIIIECLAIVLFKLLTNKTLVWLCTLRVHRQHILDGVDFDLDYNRQFPLLQDRGHCLRSCRQQVHQHDPTHQVT